MSQAKICSILIAAEQPLALEAIATKAGVEKSNASACLYTLSQAGVVERVGESKPYAWRVKNVDEAKKRTAGGMKSGRKPKGAAPTEKPAKAKRRKPVKTKPTKRRAVKRVEREASAVVDQQIYIDQDGDGEIIDFQHGEVRISFTRAQLWRLALFLVSQKHLIEPKSGRKGARR